MVPHPQRRRDCGRVPRAAVRPSWTSVIMSWFGPLSEAGRPAGEFRSRRSTLLDLYAEVGSAMPLRAASPVRPRHPYVYRGDVVDVFREFTFEAAHRLPNVPEGHKCARLHGHSYRVEVHVRGEVEPEAGWVMDFADIEAAFDTVRDRLDHRYLNEVEGLENPTSENLARWVWQRLADRLPLARVVVRETCTSGVVYRGD